MKKMLLPLMLALAGCTTPELDEEQLKPAILKAQKAGPQSKTAFLTFAYGDTREEASTKMSELINSGELPGGRFFFKKSELLDRQEWAVSQHFHNDSLESIALVWYELDKMPSWAYATVRDEYAHVYGKPVAEVAQHAVFLKGEQRIDVAQREHSLSVDYKNTRLEDALFRRIMALRYDENGSYDSTYYNQVVKPRLPKNPNGI